MSIQGLILEVRGASSPPKSAQDPSSSSSLNPSCVCAAVTGCRRLRDTEFFTRQDPYVILEYATTKLRTRTCTDGGKNPIFDEKFHIPLIEGLRELTVNVWNSNTLSHDDFIGSGRVQLHKVLTQGYDDSSWPLQTRHMRSAGEVKLILHFDVSAMKNKMGKSAAGSSTHYVPSPMPTLAPALASAVPYAGVQPSYPPASAYPASAYPAYPTPGHSLYKSAESVPPPQQPCPPMGYPATTYPPHPGEQAYPPQPREQAYPPQPREQAYPPQPREQAYPPQPYGQGYPPQPYGQPYPPPSATQSPYPPAPYPGTYPPGPY
ncbi:hypothetical protein EJB05_41665, partial [Eragrostis curvula]